MTPADVGGSLLVPTITANMINTALSDGALSSLIRQALVLLAAPIFDKLQRSPDRMNVVLQENLTGVRVIHAFNKEHHETKRMHKTFRDYASLSIQANYLFAGLDCLATVVINLIIVAVLYVGGNGVGAGTLEIDKATKALMSRRTSFVIAHRLSTIVDADNILLMKNGNIIEQGDHAHLLAAQGAYADLYNSQFA